MDDILKVTKTNFVVMKLAAGGHKHDSQVGTEYCMFEHGNTAYTWRNRNVTDLMQVVQFIGLMQVYRR